MVRRPGQYAVQPVAPVDGRGHDAGWTMVLDGGWHAGTTCVVRPVNGALLAYHYGHAGWVDWMMHVTVSAVIHAAIFQVVGRILHRLTLPEAMALVAIVLVCLFAWGRSRDRRGW